MDDKIFKKIKKELPEVRKNVLMKDFTTFKIGGPAEYFFIAKNREDLITAIKIAKELKLPIFIFGGGSNLLVSDKGVKGLVIKLQIASYKLQTNRVYADAGVSLNTIVKFCANNGLSGLEWAAGIPGVTVGGAIFGHAQAFGEKISDSLKSVEALDAKTLKIKSFTKKQCQFSLKNSIFKKEKNLIILSSVLNPEKSNKQEILERTKKFINYRKDHHPMAFPSAGSVFVNPPNNHAGYLIEKVGLKGRKIGSAQISEKHANFIINTGNAKAKDVLKLIRLAKQKVKKTFGINLETEVQLIGF